jgi:hypothetical protein
LEEHPEEKWNGSDRKFWDMTKALFPELDLMEDNSKMYYIGRDYAN